MKLRNKKTGEIYEYDKIIYRKLNSDGYVDFCPDKGCWEDYEPKEPLIKDEKIRKALRAWAEATGATNIYCYQNTRTCEFFYENLELDIYASIKFIGKDIIDTKLDDNGYTITELCGDEEA